MGKIDLSDLGVLTVGSLTLSHESSARWGAHEKEGVDSVEAAEFRFDVRRAAYALVEERGRALEIYASMDGAQDWQVDQIEPKNGGA